MEYQRYILGICSINVYVGLTAVYFEIDSNLNNTQYLFILKINNATFNSIMLLHVSDNRDNYCTNIIV